MKFFEHQSTYQVDIEEKDLGVPGIEIYYYQTLIRAWNYSNTWTFFGNPATWSRLRRWLIFQFVD